MFFISKKKNIKFKKLSKKNKNLTETSNQLTDQTDQQFKNLKFKLHKKTSRDVPHVILGNPFDHLRPGVVIQVFFDDDTGSSSELQSKSSFFLKQPAEKPFKPNGKR